jgi:hypothetical protein
MRSALAITIKTNQQKSHERLRRLINNPFHKSLLETCTGVINVVRTSINPPQK